MIQKGRFYFNWARGIELDAQQKYFELLNYTKSLLFLRDTILVNAQKVWEDIVPPTEQRDGDAWIRIIKFHEIPRPKPPYRTMWLESTLGENAQRIGMLALRSEVKANLQELLHGSNLDDALVEFIQKDAPATIINATAFHDFEGSACYSGTIIYWLDASGNFLSSFRQFPAIYDGETPSLEKLEQRQKDMLKLREGWMLHTFARMNCANARLVEIPNGSQPKHGHRHRQAPFSVWHEIQVSDAPKTRRATTAMSPQQNPDSMRFHWVRGHYADYTKGAGLFGNPKLRAVFWIPEHHAGKEEVGTVASSYQIV
jgi:hypothetical protein